MKHLIWMAMLGLFSTANLINSHQCDAQGIRDLQGKIVVDGSSTVAPITIQADSSFRDVCPNVTVPVGVSGTGGGFKRFTKGETDISDASKPRCQSI
jgi:phosphate transport system substrate-binding protein